MKELKALISTKKIIALLLSVVFSIEVVRGNISPEQFMTIFTTIIGAYFGYSISADKSKQ